MIRYSGAFVALTLTSLTSTLVGCSSDGKAKGSLSRSDGGSDAAPAGDAAAQPATFESLTATGSYGVGTREFTFVDSERATPSNGTYGGAPERTLPTKVWYPTAAGGDGAAPASGDGPFPVIAYAHGFLSNLGEADALKRHLASHGYVVVAATFPISTITAPGGASFRDLGNQPGDLAFIVHQVSTLSGADADLAQAVDLHHLGVAGLSLGGATTLIAVYHPTLHLPDVKAAVAYAPAGCFFGPGLYEHSAPTVILGGSADELVPFSSIESRAQKLAPPPLLVAKLVGGTHVGFMGIDIPDAGNTDAIIGCPSVQGALGGDAGASFAGLAADLNQGVDGGAFDVTGCAGVCSESFQQTMRGTRQLEIAKAVTLAHFEAVFRGRADASQFLASGLDANNDDVEVTRKK